MCACANCTQGILVIHLSAIMGTVLRQYINAPTNAAMLASKCFVVDYAV